jgi:transcriptional regulator with XRE-family HTH domain
MTASGPPGSKTAAAGGRPAGGRPAGAGAIVRAARQRAGLTLAELGRRCGYSASQISRYERGIQPLTDITVLRRFAEALQIAPQMFGLAPANGGRGRHADVKPCRGDPAGPIVGRDHGREDGDDPVRRRELLAGAAGLASAGALGLPSPSRNRAGPRASVEEALYSSRAATTPVPVKDLRMAVAAARADFQTARYDRLARSLPGLIATATATRRAAGTGEQAVAATLLAEACITSANFMVKLNDDPLALALADRALQAATVGGDPLTAADARRAVATVLRRTGRRAAARDLLLSAAHDIEPAGHTNPEQLSVYGTLLEVAAYTAAVDGDRQASSAFIGEAKATAARLGHDANHRFTAFGPTNVTLYQVSIAQVLGDSGTAIEHAKTLRPSAIPTAERQGRYWIDVARAYHQWRKPDYCYRALLAAERAAPAEVRYRPPVHRITEDLLRAKRHLPGLEAFARRIGLPAA